MTLPKDAELIPIGTVCYRAGNFTEYTQEIVIDDNNQKLISMLWNSTYFLNKKDADRVTYKNHCEYEYWVMRSNPTFHCFK